MHWQRYQAPGMLVLPCSLTEVHSTSPYMQCALPGWQCQCQHHFLPSLMPPVWPSLSRRGRSQDHSPPRPSRARGRASQSSPAARAGPRGCRSLDRKSGACSSDQQGGACAPGSLGEPHDLTPRNARLTITSVSTAPDALGALLRPPGDACRTWRLPPSVGTASRVRFQCACSVCVLALVLWSDASWSAWLAQFCRVLHSQEQVVCCG